MPKTINQQYFEMYTRNISKYNSFEKLKERILSNPNNINEDTIQAIEKYYKKYKRKPKYWMLISNPEKWGDGTQEYEVNDLLFNLKKDSWKVNSQIEMHLKMREGDLGIIKASEDRRSQKQRINHKGETVKVLTPGIYAIFQIVKDSDGDVVRKSNDGEWFVNIKIIENFFAKNNIIPKEEAIELLGKSIYENQGNREIDKELYDKIVAYTK